MARLGFHHHHGVARARDNQIEVALRVLRHERIDDELTVDAPHAHRAYRSAKGDIRDAERRRCADNAQHVGRILLIGAENGDDDLDLVAVVLGEERPQRAVAKPRRQHTVVAGPALAPQIPAGNPADGVVLFFHVNGERKEIDPLTGLRARDRDQQYRVAATDRYAAAGLLGKPPGLDADRTTGVVCLYFVNHTMDESFPRPTPDPPCG